MDEFFSLIDFVNPSSLAPSLAAFKRVYGDVIAHGRDHSASDDEKMLGHERSRCLVLLSSLPFRQANVSFHTLVFEDVHVHEQQWVPPDFACTAMTKGGSSQASRMCIKHLERI
jgi:hypothetical protein